MARLSRFARSQKAHRRLYNKYGNKTDRVGRHKAFYHWDCHKSQEKLGRVLTPSEKKTLWNSYL